MLDIILIVLIAIGSIGCIFYIIDVSIKIKNYIKWDEYIINYKDSIKYNIQKTKVMRNRNNNESIL